MGASLLPLVELLRFGKHDMWVAFADSLREPLAPMERRVTVRLGRAGTKVSNAHRRNSVSG